MNSFQSDISQYFSKTYPEIFRFAFSASRRYKKYTIPKRTGGSRKISQPSKELKEYQRYIVSSIFEKFPIHDAVYSYQKNVNIKKMAAKHMGANFLLRIDFKDFFPSIKGDYIREFIFNNIHYLQNMLDHNDITLINLLVCKSNKLTIGAPSSPIISNVILYDLDKYLFEICKEKNIIYTRYADDLYFSTDKPNILKNLIPIVKSYLQTFFIKLSINEDKNIFTSRKRRQQVTGLILTTNNKLSIGRDKKRYIRSLIYKYTKDLITGEEVNYLKGYLSYLHSIEPEYIENLKRKYTITVMKELFPLKD